jgi:hypothetical protein
MAISIESLQKTTIKQNFLMVLFGTAGIGKTTVGASMNDVVFLDIEGGINADGVSSWKIETYQDVIDAISVLYSEDHPFKSVVIDSITAFEPLLHNQLCINEGAQSVEKIGGGFAKYRVESLPMWETIIAGFNALVTHRKMNVMIIGHSKVTEIKPPETDPYLKYDIDLLNPKATNLLYRHADIVGFANYKVMTTSTGEGIKKTTRGIGTGDRILHLEERPAYYAKNRFDLPAELPLDWQAINEAIKAHSNPTQKVA